MDKSQNEQTPPQTPFTTPPAQTPVSTPVTPTPTPKRKRSTLAITTSFLAGAVLYALVTMFYNLYTQQNQTAQLADTLAAKLQVPQASTSSSNSASTPSNTTVSSKDIAAYVDPVDCTTKSSFSSYKRGSIFVLVKSIDIYDGIQLGTSSGSGYITNPIRWSTLPTVVDYQCNTIKLSDIKVGDRIDTYTIASKDSSTLPLVLIQRAVK